MAEVTPQSILFGLPALEWRGLEAPPYDTAPISVTHNQSPRKFPYIDGAGHDHTGRDPIRMTVRLFFINTLDLTAGIPLFPDLFELWKDALLDGSSGDLRHPILGPVRARVMTFDVNLDANVSLAGATVTVNWEDTIDNPAEQSDFEPLENNVTALAEAADNAMSALGIDFPDGGPSNLANLLQQLEGFIFSAQLSVSGLINQAQGVVEQLVDTIGRRDDALDYPALDNLTLLHSALTDASLSIGSQRSRGTTTTTFPFATTLPTVGGEVGNTTEELMSLNLALLRSPSIPPNTPITVYTE